jgi:hypothetical protein
VRMRSVRCLRNMGPRSDSVNQIEGRFISQALHPKWRIYANDGGQPLDVLHSRSAWYEGQLSRLAQPFLKMNRVLRERIPGVICPVEYVSGGNGPREA